MQASSFASSHPPPVYLPPTFNRILSCISFYWTALPCLCFVLTICIALNIAHNGLEQHNKLKKIGRTNDSQKMFKHLVRANDSQKMFKKLGRTNVSQQSAPPNVSQLQWPRNFEATFEAGPPLFSRAFFLSSLNLPFFLRHFSFFLGPPLPQIPLLLDLSV